MRTNSESMTVPEFAQAMGVSETLVYRLIREDAMPVPVIKLGTRKSIPRRAVEELLGQMRSPDAVQAPTPATTPPTDEAIAQLYELGFTEPHARMALELGYTPKDIECLDPRDKVVVRMHVEGAIAGSKKTTDRLVTRKAWRHP